MTRHAVLYARISVATEESVSVARQLASGRKYAAARGWKVVGEYVDEGVSATRNKPADRPAWQALLAAETAFQAVVVWKVDRLARRVMDFLQVDEVLQARGAAIVCVEQSLDMTTGEGRAFAQMLAVFGELEAATISSRRVAARQYLVAHGRSAGGRQPYGWLLVPHPSGPGKVRAQDPERIDWVRAMVERALRGDTVYSILLWLQESDAPRARKSRAQQPWCYSSVNTILRNPALAGMTPHNPGNSAGGTRGPDVLRNPDGTPLIADDAILSLKDFERLQRIISRKTHHSAIPRSQRRRTSSMLALLATCAQCQVRLHRHGVDRGLSLRCKRCGQTISYRGLADYLIVRMLRERGSLPTFRSTWFVPDDAAASRKLAEIDQELTSVALSLKDEQADTARLTAELLALKQARTRARNHANGPSAQRLVETGRTLSDVWGLLLHR